jgi:hypothetical protein
MKSKLYVSSSKPLVYYAILAVLFLAVFEGALEKWIGIQLNVIVVFRDLCAIFVISAAIFYKSFLKFYSISLLLFFWTLLIFVVGALQVGFNDLPIVVYIAGVRFWLLYLWFALAAASYLNEEQSINIGRFFIKMGVIVVLLAIVQSALPPGHILNVQPNAPDEETIFLLSEGIVRVTSTFTFTLGYTCFIALFMWVFTNPKYNLVFSKSVIFERKVILSCFILLLAFMYSGSRSAVLWFFIYFPFVFFQMGSAMTVSSLIKKFILLCFFGVFGTILVSLFFSEMIDAYITRFTTAAQHENVSARILNFLVGEARVVDEFKFFGYGLGAGSNIGSKIITGGAEGFYLSETEQGKLIGEMGFIGLFWVNFRSILLVGAMVWSMGDINKRKQVFLISFVLLYLSYATPVSGQNTANIIFYIGVMFIFLEIKFLSLSKYSSTRVAV